MIRAFLDDVMPRLSAIAPAGVAGVRADRPPYIIVWVFTPGDVPYERSASGLADDPGIFRFQTTLVGRSFNEVLLLQEAVTLLLRNYREAGVRVLPDTEQQRAARIGPDNSVSDPPMFLPLQWEARSTTAIERG